MNIKFLKFIVVFMGVLIIFGMIVLGFSIYIKLNNLSNSSNPNNIVLDAPENMNFLDYKIIEDKIYISYSSIDKVLIKVYSFKTGSNIKKIEILK